MTTAQLVEEVWWWAPAKGFPWRWSGTRNYPVLLVGGFVDELLRRVVRQRSWRGLALRPREVAQCIERLRRIHGLSAQGKMVIDSLTEQLGHCRRVGLVI